MMPPVPNPILVHIEPTATNYAFLADTLRPEDVVECEAMGWSTRDALWFALADCPEGCRAIGSLVRGSHEPVIVGAYGYNHRNNVWALFADLTFQESKVMLANSNMALAKLMQDSGKDSLWNYVATQSRATMHWLAKLPAITIDRTTPHKYGGIEFAPFIAQRRSPLV